MKNLARIIYLISFSLLMSSSILDGGFQNFSSSPPPILSRIDINHGFSFSTQSLGGFSQSYSTYSNTLLFNISDQATFYSNLNLISPLSSFDYNERLGYSIDMGMQYNINENTILLFKFSTNKHAGLYNSTIGNY
tara:strand:+ start:1203 stop:1607 length:405 start_codon:yes stop_codon:yes gene_type:complete